MNIVLVHYGDFFYDYINDCINQIRKFNNCDIYLIISEKFNNIIEDKSIIIENIEKLKQTENHKIFDKVTHLDRHFRGGFWKFATERFFSIEDLMIKYNLTDVFHFENDNLIYFNIEDYIKIFQENYKLASVFDNDLRCIPSVVYIKNVSYLKKLNEFILIKKGNDMENLAKFKLTYTDLFANLPQIPESYKGNMISAIGGKTENRLDYSKNINLFNSIFDGAAIGQYLGGVDPRNSPGDTTGFINESSLYNISDFKFEFIDNIPYMYYENEKYKINNLHIHSKKLNKFV